MGYLLEVIGIIGQLHVILVLDGLEMVNNHFVDGSLLSVRAEKDSIDGALGCLDTFYFASCVMVSSHKTDFLVSRGGCTSELDPCCLVLYSSWG